MNKVLGDPKNVNCIPLFLHVSPCHLCYCPFKTQELEVEPEPVFCPGSMETGGARVPLRVGEHSDKAVCLVSLWAAKRASWGILSGPGQREAEAFFGFSLNSVGNCLVQVSKKLHLSILDCFRGNVLTLVLAMVARASPVPGAGRGRFSCNLCFHYHSGESCCENWSSPLPPWVTAAAPVPAATLDRAATTRREPVRWHGANGSATGF